MNYERCITKEQFQLYSEALRILDIGLSQSENVKTNMNRRLKYQTLIEKLKCELDKAKRGYNLSVDLYPEIPYFTQISEFIENNGDVNVLDLPNNHQFYILYLRNELYKLLSSFSIVLSDITQFSNPNSAVSELVSGFGLYIDNLNEINFEINNIDDITTTTVFLVNLTKDKNISQIYSDIFNSEVFSDEKHGLFKQILDKVNSNSKSSSSLSKISEGEIVSQQINNNNNTSNPVESFKESYKIFIEELKLKIKDNIHLYTSPNPKYDIIEPFKYLVNSMFKRDIKDSLLGLLNYLNQLEDIKQERVSSEDYENIYQVIYPALKLLGELSKPKLKERYSVIYNPLCTLNTMSKINMEIMRLTLDDNKEEWLSIISDLDKVELIETIQNKIYGMLLGIVYHKWLVNDLSAVSGYTQI